MDDIEVQNHLKKLTRQIRGGDDGMPPQKVSTEQLDLLLNLVRSGQLSPKYYEYYRQNSSQSANRAYRLSPDDREAYQEMNPTNPKDGVDTALSFVLRNKQVPEHLLDRLNRFYEKGQLSQEEYERIFRPKNRGNRMAGQNNQAKPAQGQQAGQQQQTGQQQQPAQAQQAAPAQQQPQQQPQQQQQNGQKVDNIGGQDPFVQVSLGTVLKNLHMKAAAEVNKATGGRIQILNSAYDSQTGGFNTAPGVYSVRAASTRPLDALGNWFRSKTARKALVMYLNSFLGPELAERFKNASLYQPTTTNKDGDVIQKKNGVFGRLKNWATGKSYDQSAAGSKGSVKDVSNKVISYWMKYKLVNGGSGAANESWIKFAMPGKPLVNESVEKPSEANGWVKLTPARLMECRRAGKSDSERFVESALYDDGEAAARALKTLLESRLSKRFSDLEL